MGVVLGTSYIITPRQVLDLRLIPGCIATLPFFVISIMKLKEFFWIVVICCVTLFLPLSAAVTGHSVAAFLGIIPGMAVLVYGSELLVDYSDKHWKD